MSLKQEGPLVKRGAATGGREGYGKKLSKEPSIESMPELEIDVKTALEVVSTRSMGYLKDESYKDISKKLLIRLRKGWVLSEGQIQLVKRLIREQPGLRLGDRLAKGQFSSPMNFPSIYVTNQNLLQ